MQFFISEIGRRLIIWICMVGVCAFSAFAQENDGKSPSLHQLKQFFGSSFKAHTIADGTLGNRKIFKIGAETSFGQMDILVDTQGLPILLIQEIGKSEIPDAITHALPSNQAAHTVEKWWWVLFELEMTSGINSPEKVFDGQGELQFEWVEQEKEQRIPWESVPLQTRNRLAPFLRDATPVIVKSIREWHMSLYEFQWQSEQGWQEIKTLANGDPVLWEPSHYQRFPKVLEGLIQEEAPEVVLLALYAIGANEKTFWWPDGRAFEGNLTTEQLH